MFLFIIKAMIINRTGFAWGQKEALNILRIDVNTPLPADSPKSTADSGAVQIRTPSPEDAVTVNDLVARCPPLDRNSLYFYLLQCSQFAETSAVAMVDGKIIGFVAAHRVPESPQTLFVWQIAVDPDSRQRGLGKEMLLGILKRPASADIVNVSATVTGDNGPSSYMFCALARRLSTSCRRSLLFDRDRHFAGRHASEFLLDIGPFEQPRTSDQREGI